VAGCGQVAFQLAMSLSLRTIEVCFVKAQSRGFDIIALSSSGSQLKEPPNGGLLFAFRSVQDCNSSGSLAIFAAIRSAAV
jgi:hypothetical protein